MSVLRSPRTTAWQAERQPHGSFGHTRCAFYPSAMSMDISVPLGTTLHFHPTLQYTSLLPKVIDFKRTNWYMWSIWKRGVSTVYQHHREKHRFRMKMPISHQSLLARCHHPQESPSISTLREAANGGAGSEERSWTFYRSKSDVRYIGRRQINNFLQPHMLASLADKKEKSRS